MGRDIYDYFIGYNYIRLALAKLCIVCDKGHYRYLVRIRLFELVYDQNVSLSYLKVPVLHSI